MPSSAEPLATPLRLEAADGLALVLGAREPWHVEWGERDWLGPVGLRVRHGVELWRGPPSTPDDVDATRSLHAALSPFEGSDDLGAFRGVHVDWPELPLGLRTSVRAYAERPLLVFRLEASEPLSSLATGVLSEPSVAWPWLRPDARAGAGLPEGTRAFGYQYTEFGFPTVSDPSLCGFLLLPESFRPAVVEPLWLLAPDGRSLMLIPLDAFHEQVIAVPRGADRANLGVRCGWHGDLERVPRGFASELALWAGSGPRRVLEAWGATLRGRHATRRRSRYADDAVGKLSYWTDNGGAYWYRSAPDCDVPTTLERVATSLRDQGVPVSAFQLDSWFYPHEVLRAFDAEEIDVPPTGMLAWEPREDVLPEGIAPLRERLGSPPLILHGRHFSSRSPYFQRHEAWIDGDRAHPQGPELFDRLLGQAATWGAIQYEQDWLIECFLGVRGLREEPGRALAWQQALDRAAGANGLSLLWCMASPADFFATLRLDHVGSIRTSGDYRYIVGNAALWCWFLFGNALARALGLWPFKDVFLSRRDGEGLEGDPHAEAEALLSALSAGPVGIGDRVGRTDPELVARTCRRDGVLVKPDLPIAALERCFRAHPNLEPEPLLGETWSAHPAGRWIYLAALNAHRHEERLESRLALAELGEAAPQEPVMAYDWRSGAFRRLHPSESLALSLAPRDWHLTVLCPLLPAGIAIFGDVERYATAGDRRLRDVRPTPTGVRFEILGAPGERVRIEGWSDRALARCRTWTPAGERGVPAAPRDATARERWTRDPGDGRLRLQVVVPKSGWIGVEIELEDA